MRGNVIVQITMSGVDLTLIQHILGVLREECQLRTNEVRCGHIVISSCG